MPDIMLRHLPQIIGLLWGASELFLTVTRRAKRDATSWDRHSLTIIWMICLIGIVLGIFAADQLPGCRLPSTKVIGWVALGLFILGLVLRWYSIIHLGRFFTVNVAISSDHRVVDTGPYRWVRHPSYSGSLLAMFGLALSLQNWASLLCIAVSCCAATLWRIHIEEAALVGALGESYRSYMRRTKRLIPLIY